MKTTKAGLALGAGGARGFAHIGALRALEEAAMVPDAVAGSSMGAVIGAMIAAGRDAEAINSLVTDRSRIRRPVLGRHGGLIGHGKMIDAFCGELPDRIEDLGMPFAAVAVDISRGETVVIDSGPLRPALCASVAVPGILDPVIIDGRHLVDGGVVNALPVDVVGAMTASDIIAIDVAPARDREIAFDDTDPWWQQLLDRVMFRHRPLPVDLFLKAFAIQQSLITDDLMRRHPPRHYIEIDMDASIRLEDFHRYEEIIDAGYRSTLPVLKRD